MLSWLKLSHHRHTGQMTPHEHTSYIPLILLLGLVGFVLTVYSASAIDHPGPESGSIGLTGVMPGKPPTTAATINLPTNQQRFSVSPITVSGTCPKDTLVEVFKNDIFAGSTPCTEAGIYTVEIDLLIGQNILVARVYDALNQPGPDSNLVTIFYDALPAQAGSINSLDFGGAQLLLNTDAVFRGAFPDQDLNVPIEILGGTPPYAVNVQWGDTTNSVIPRNDNVSFVAIHNYKKPGTYQISLQATDAAGRVAFLTVASIINGQPAITATASPQDSNVIGKLLVLWPLYTSAIAIVVSFWLGERREKRILSTRGLLLSPQE